MKRTDTAEKNRALPKEENELLLYREKRQQRRKKIHNRRKRILISLFLGILVIYLSLNWSKFAPQSISDTVQQLFGVFGPGQFPQQIASGNFIQAEPIGNNIAVLTDTSVILYSQSGTELDSRQHGMSDPQLAAEGGKAVLYDRGGKTFKAETRFNEPFSATVSYPIITAAVSRSGSVAVATESGSYLSELTVYDSEYKKIFKWYSSKGRVLSMAFSPDGSRIGAVLISAKNGEIRSSVYVFRTDSQKPLSVADYDGVLLYSLQYAQGGRLSAVGDTETVFQDDAGHKLKNYPYNGKSLKSFANQNGYAALAFDAYAAGDSSEIVSIKADGSRAGDITVKQNIQSLYITGEHLLGLSDSGVWQSDCACKKSSLIKAPEDKIGVTVQKNYAYVFSLQSIYRYRLNS